MPMTSKAEKLNRLMKLLGDDDADGESLPELYKAITVRKNKEYALAVARVDFSRRLVLVPQCLRSTATCSAVEDAAEYVCSACGACKIAAIAARAAELGYPGIHVLKGGSAVARLIQELKPGAVIGVACDFEGALGIMECERWKIPVQFVPLLRDGCADTDVDLSELFDVLEFKQL
ncbi:MAG: DUF116 domain-containing protein [Planctomycetes bacterium]|nr:DUF116 domain-containing protein [Planctomycetota bacterium]